MSTETPEPAEPNVDQASPPRFATGGYIPAPSGDPDDRIPAVLSEGGCLLYWRGDHSGNHPLDEHPSAKFPQVAFEDPQVARGWLGRWLGRMFGKEQP